MSDVVERREFKLVESEDLFWDELREISGRLGWEISQTIKACFALGWEQLTKINKESTNDKTELE